MIVFGNIYYKNHSNPRFNIIALYQNGKLIELDKEKKKEIFPNTGSVFVPPNINVSNEKKYGLYKIYESHTYEPDKLSSLKYVLGSEVTDLLYEVIQIREEIEPEQLNQRFQYGFQFSYEPLMNILIHTADDYLIGPVQLKKRINDDVWEVPDANFAPYYENKLEFLRYENVYDNEPERFFVVSDFTKQQVVGYVDIANNERAVREILKLIRENVDVGELSRKVIRQLGEWGNTGYIAESQLQQRLYRVVRILNTHTLEESLMEEVQKTIFDLPYVQSYVKSELKSFQNKYQKKIEEEHRVLLNEVKRLKNDINQLNRELNNKRKDKERLEHSIQQLQEKSEEKIAEIQTNALDVFVNQLMIRGLSAAEVSATSLNPSSKGLQSQAESMLFSVSSKLNAPIYGGLEEFWRAVDQRIRIPDFKLLSQTVICAIATNSPIVITGKSSLEMAQLIVQSVAANEGIIVLPEVHNFSLNRLVETFKQFKNEQAIKALVLHNPHLTSAEFSILPFLMLKRWTNEFMYPDLVILTLDELEGHSNFIKKLKIVPILNADELFKKSVSKRATQSEGSGQLLLSSIDEMKIEKNIDLQEAFEEWILDKHDLELNPWPKQLDDWLYYFNYDDMYNNNKAMLFDWVWFVFEDSLRREFQRSDMP